MDVSTNPSELTIVSRLNRYSHNHSVSLNHPQNVVILAYRRFQGQITYDSPLFSCYKSFLPKMQTITNGFFMSTPSS